MVPIFAPVLIHPAQPSRIVIMKDAAEAPSHSSKNRTSMKSHGMPPLPGSSTSHYCCDAYTGVGRTEACPHIPDSATRKVMMSFAVMTLSAMSRARVALERHPIEKNESFASDA